MYGVFSDPMIIIDPRFIFDLFCQLF